MSIGLTVAISIFVLVLLVLWIMLPFAVMSVKEKLAALVTETRANNVLLGEIRDILKRAG